MFSLHGVSVLQILIGYLSVLTAAQQYEGEVITNSLPNVPGSTIAYFKIQDPKGSSANLTLTNYISLNKAGNHLVESKVRRAVIVVHGLNRDPETYISNMLSALADVKNTTINRDTVALMAPYFPNGADKNTGYPWTDGLKAGRGSTTSALVWSLSNWADGSDNQYPYKTQTVSSYEVMDQLINYFDNSTIFPNMEEIVVAGHSLGAQMLQRYAAVGNLLDTKSRIIYYVANPNSYLWFDSTRPLAITDCPDYDDWRDGLAKYTASNTYGADLVASGRDAVLARYNSRSIAYGRGLRDLGDDSANCAPFSSGANRNERFYNFIKKYPPTCTEASACSTIDYVNAGHDAGSMFASAAGRARLFTDNFLGDGYTTPDFYCPRQQAGDDPDPNTAVAKCGLKVIGAGTFAGNMTYAGCWQDVDLNALSKVAYATTSSNTVDKCTTACNKAGYTIAGAENGNLCYCGNSISGTASLTADGGCLIACPGNSSQICGDLNRLSIYSNGAPTHLVKPSTPAVVGKYSFQGCVLDNNPGRSLTAKSTAGSTMTLESCATYCSGYKYFGTEYADECYCGNTLAAGATIAAASDCSATCAGNAVENCGASNRLTLFMLNSSLPVTSASSSRTSSGTSSGTSKATSKTTSKTTSTQSSSVSSATSSALACPASNGTIYKAPSGNSFEIECYDDRTGTDLATVSYATTLAQCIGLCDSTASCVAYSWVSTQNGVSNPCYLKSTLGSDRANTGVWGGRLISSGTSSSSAKSSSTSSVKSSTSSSKSTSTSSVKSTSTSSSKSSSTSLTKTSSTSSTKSSSTSSVVSSSTSSAKSSSTSSSRSTVTTTSKSVTSASTSSTVKTSSSAGASASAVACPASNGTLFSASSGRQFEIECYNDLTGTDLTLGYVTTLAACINLCDSTATCVAYSWVSTANGPSNPCYLKSTVGVNRVNNGVWGGKLVSSSASSIGSSKAASSTSSHTSSASTATSRSTSTSSTPLTPSKTTTSSTSARTSSASTSSPVSTLIKSTSSTSSKTTTTSSASKSTSASTSTKPSTKTSTTSAATSASVISCPGSNGTTFVSTGGQTFLIECYNDHTGTDFTSGYATSLAGCVDLCSTTATCVAFSWVSTQNGVSNPCYLKSTVGGDRTNSGVWGGKVVSAVSSVPSSTPKSSAGSSSSTVSRTSVSPATSSTSSSGAVKSPTAASSFVSPAKEQVSTQQFSTTTTTILTSSTTTVIIGDQPTGAQGIPGSSSTPLAVPTSSSSTSQVVAASSSSTPLPVHAVSPSAAPAVPTSSPSLSSSPVQSPTSTSAKISMSSSSSITTPKLSYSFTANSSSTSTSSVSSSTSTDPPVLPTGITSIGCYEDKAVRELSHTAGDSSTNTPLECAEKCRAAGYIYSGTEYSTECYCGNIPPTTPSTECDKTCAGNETQTCGGAYALSVTNDTLWTAPLTTLQTYDNTTLLGCYHDKVATRTLSSRVPGVRASTATQEICISSCVAAGFSYCGLEYYGECYGSKTKPASSLAATSDSGSTDPYLAGCSYACNGNSTQSCGGSDRLLIWELDPSTF